VLKKISSVISCGFTCGNIFPAEFYAVLSAEFSAGFNAELPADYSQKRLLQLHSRFRQKSPQETITYKSFSWEPKSAGNSAGNTFLVNFLPKSAENRQISNSDTETY
jgi:hypothetical protein